MLLDATKAFDKVSYKVLFNILLKKNVCPRIVNLLYYMYSNQLCHLKWGDKTSAGFSISNGVKRGGVILPLLFSLYIDELFFTLKTVWPWLSRWSNIMLERLGMPMIWLW